MKKKIITSILLLAIIIGVTACDKKKKEEVNPTPTPVVVNEDAKKFKEDYESLNGKKNSRGLEHRTVKIDENNPFVYASAEEIVKKIKNKETFYVYFGDTLCPWCRSAIEMAIKVANEQNIKTIYYVPIWDKDGNEILRDKYKLNDEGKLEQVVKGTDAYYELIDLFKDVLDDYNVTDSDGNKVATGEKRIFAPNYIYVEKGNAMVKVDGTSENQKDSREELTKELLDDERIIFESLFIR